LKIHTKSKSDPHAMLKNEERHRKWRQEENTLWWRSDHGQDIGLHQTN
jgi:hypothetical protein